MAITRDDVGMSMNEPQRPRSTPIPGAGDFDAPPPTAAQFLGSPSPVPPGQQASGPYPGTPVGPFAQMPPGGNMPQAFLAPRRRRSFLGCFVWVIVLTSILAGVGAAVWGVWVAKDAIERSDDLSDPDLSDRDREALGLPDDVETLLQDGGAEAVVGAFEDAIGESPLRVTEILIYPDYAFVEAQDPVIPTNLDRYMWRSGSVGEPDAESNRDDLESELFFVDEVNYGVIANLAAQSPAALGIVDGETSYIIITRTAFGAGEVVIRCYVNSERDSGYLEARASTGEVLAGY